jgi:hypothetical protein
MKQHALVTDWSLRGVITLMYVESGLAGGRLCGKVYGHADFEDGDEITSSRIVSMDLSRRIVETNNTIYELTKPSLAYVLFCAKYKLDLSWLKTYTEAEMYGPEHDIEPFTFDEMVNIPGLTSPEVVVAAR